MTQYRKKLIEVALPLDAINAESIREKYIRHGHPSTLHLWWSRKPLATTRAVLFSQVIDDPSEYIHDENSAIKERERLFNLIADLAKWDNINNEKLLDKAHLEIARSVARDLGEPMPVGKEAIREFLATKAPPVLDPFAGGGSIPLEAQRLGLRAYASDLNPVAVLINKALIEMPSKFSGMPPVHPPEDVDQQLILINKRWKGAEGIAEDIRYYGKWINDEAKDLIGHLYPNLRVTSEMLKDRLDLIQEGIKPGDEFTVIAWLWVRTVKCPNPACGIDMPLTNKWWLSSKKRNPTWIIPITKQENNLTKIEYKIKTGAGSPPDGTVSRSGGIYCVVCKTPATFDYVREKGKSGEIDAVIIATVVEGNRKRIYLPPFDEGLLNTPDCDFLKDEGINNISGYINPPLYGYTSIGSWFTPRQLFSLKVFSNLVNKAKALCLTHSSNDEYSNAIALYLALAVGRLSNRMSSFAIWDVGSEKIAQTFSEQGVGMTWDFAEVNPFSNSTGNWLGSLEWIPKCIEIVPTGNGLAEKRDAGSNFTEPKFAILNSDPPYYSSITYADLSDFFYSTFRSILKEDYKDLFDTLTTPKETEIVAASHRFGGKEAAALHFREKLRLAIKNLSEHALKDYPIVIYYAFKQAEFSEDNGYYTAWESILSVLIECNLKIINTWPLRTEAITGRKSDKNVLATSIVLVCRLKNNQGSIITRRDFYNKLQKELPNSLRQFQKSFIAPLDIAQAAIGPGMAVYSRYQQVLEADGSNMSVRTALALINQSLDEFLAEQEGEYDADTRWALAWFEQYGFNEGPFGVAETLSKAKNTSVGGLEEAGVLVARAGKVRLLSCTELKEDWDPSQDKRPTTWEAVQYLIRALDTHGEQGAALLLSRLGRLGETARDLAYRLYTICERKGWAQDALGYNMLVVAWPRLKEMASKAREEEQGRLI